MSREEMAVLWSCIRFGATLKVVRSTLDDHLLLSLAVSLGHFDALWSTIL